MGQFECGHFCILSNPVIDSPASMSNLPRTVTISTLEDSPTTPPMFVKINLRIMVNEQVLENQCKSQKPLKQSAFSGVIKAGFFLIMTLPSTVSHHHIFYV